MGALRVSSIVSADPAQVWDWIARYERWPEWGTSIRDVEADGERVREGARGRVQTVVGLWLPFVITRVEPGRAWSWRVAGVSATGHEVEPHPRGSRVTFTAPRWAGLYRPVLRDALRRLEAMARAGG